MKQLTQLSNKEIGQSTVSSMLPFLKFIAVEHNLKLNTLIGFNKAKELLIKSAMLN